MYNKAWTQFETQSLAFATLRKHLYPNYLVRGDADNIIIYRPTADTRNPTKLLTVKVFASNSAGESAFTKMEDNTYHLIGGDKAFKVLGLVTPLI